VARTIKQIEDSMKDSIELKDNTVDSTNGPVWDILINPVPKELSASEQEASMLAQLHSTEYASVATGPQVAALRTSMRSPEGSGERATSTQLFWTPTIPEEGINIPIGTIISVKDGSLLYQTTREIVVSGEATAFYSTDDFRYEFTVSIEAITSGTDYNIPIGRITEIVSDIEGISGTENISEAKGGTQSESKADTVSRLQKQFLGFDRGTDSGLISTYIYNEYPTLIKDLGIVKPKDLLFKRLTSRPAMDIYVSGTDPKNFVDTYTITAEDEVKDFINIVLENNPSLEITKVELAQTTTGGFNIILLEEGIDTNQYQYIRDDTVYAGSVYAQDLIKVNSTNIFAGDKITITYNSENLVINIQTILFNNEARMFDTDVLIKKALETEIRMSIMAKLLTLPSDSRSEEILTNLTQDFVDYIEDGRVGVTIEPEVMRQQILSISENVINLYIKVFRKTTYSYQEVEVVTLDKNAIAKVEEGDVPFSVTMVK